MNSQPLTASCGNSRLPVRTVRGEFKSVQLIERDTQLQALLVACKSTTASLSESARLQKLCNFLTDGFLPPMNDVARCQALIYLDRSLSRLGVPAALDRWKTMDGLHTLSRRIATPNARQALERVWQRCVPQHFFRNIDGSSALAIAGLNQSTPGSYIFWTDASKPLNLMIALRAPGYAPGTMTVAELVSKVVKETDASGNVVMAQLQRVLVAMNAIPPAVTEPPRTGRPLAPPPIVLNGGKRNKYLGPYRPSELARANGALIATVLQSSHRGGFAKVRWGLLEVSYRQPPEPVAVKAMRSVVAAKQGRLTLDLRRRVQPMQTADILNETTLTNRFAPAIAFKYVVNVRDTYFAIQRRMAGNAVDLMQHVQDTDRDVVVNSIARQTAYQLSRMADRGYNHRDVKPDNVLWDGDGLVTLSDFGLAAQFRTETRRSGTLRYMPLEALQGKIDGERYDVWSWALLVMSLYADRARPSPFSQDVIDVGSAAANIANFADWQRRYVVEGTRWFENSDALASKWGKGLAHIRATNQPLADYILANAVLARPEMGRETMRSVMLFTQALQPEDSPEELRAREVLRVTKEKFATPEADRALSGYREARRLNLI